MESRTALRICPMLNTDPRHRYELAILEALTGCEFEQVRRAENAFADDAAETNIAVILEQRGLENLRSL